MFDKNKFHDVENCHILILKRCESLLEQILSQDFLEKFGKDIINLHHGLLPAFRGSNPYRRAYDHGVKLVGATCHFVTEVGLEETLEDAH